MTFLKIGKQYIPNKTTYKVASILGSASHGSSMYPVVPVQKNVGIKGWGSLHMDELRVFAVC